MWIIQNSMYRWNRGSFEIFKPKTLRSKLYEILDSYLVLKSYLSSNYTLKSCLYFVSDTLPPRSWLIVTEPVTGGEKTSTLTVLIPVAVVSLLCLVTSIACIVYMRRRNYIRYKSEWKAEIYNNNNLMWNITLIWNVFWM